MSTNTTATTTTTTTTTTSSSSSSPRPDADADAEANADITMSSPLPPAAALTQEPPEPKYGGFSRFELELEFVQTLANPSYLLHLATTNTTTNTPTSTNTTTTTTTPAATTPLLAHPPFIAYLAYLTYFTRPPYTRYLTYPGPTLQNLRLLQSERFRRDVLSPEVVGRLGDEGIRAAVELHAGRS